MLKKNQQTSTLPTYQFIFSPDYWKSAAKQYTFLHIIAIVGVLIALDVAISTLFIPVGDNLRIKFDFLSRAVIGMVGRAIPCIKRRHDCGLTGVCASSGRRILSRLYTVSHVRLFGVCAVLLSL